ncbi:hypothetical protein [Jannaschia rubra]|uniref:Uncharacterized protein n=1 Tax=Jannaschia rubra TaxID=282197 RepID=A0A0M6XSC8_9RHOB|nr:hypothetical protein [Jannaschia rubra]CTQ34059.1 hypothetical protein JAN5088_02851 [Jannaschia rubra]SFG24087.1 hypothetical protein SAMN04488517_103287 [Jannaschia rubra]
MAAQLQALDIVQQTLLDLGALFDRLARDGGAGDFVLSDNVLGAIRQATLRRRLAEGAQDEADPPIELF